MDNEEKIIKLLERQNDLLEKLTSNDSDYPDDWSDDHYESFSNVPHSPINFRDLVRLSEHPTDYISFGTK